MPMHASDQQAKWLHDLRNAINAASVSVHVARRLLEDGEMDRALSFLADVQSACERCRVLTAHPPFPADEGSAD